MRTLLAFVLSGPWMAALAVFGLLALSLTPVGMLVLAQIPGLAILALIALHLGGRQAIQVAIVSLLALAVFASVMNFGMNKVWISGLGMLMVLVASVIMRQGYSLAVGLQSVIVIGLLTVLLVFVIAEDPAGYWTQFLQQRKTILGQLLVSLGSTGSDKEIAQVIDLFAPLFTGGLIGLLVLLNMLALLLGRYWQSQVRHPGAFGDEFAGVRFSQPLSLLALVVIGLTFFVNVTILGNLASVMLVAYIVPGLALIHGMAKLTSMGMSLVVVTYILMFVMIGVMMPLLATLGVADSWANFRNRNRDGKTGNGN